MTKITLSIILFLLFQPITPVRTQVRHFTIFPNYASAQKDSIFGFKEIRRPKVAVVLSGGGARGISHVAALEVLEKNNIPIDLIVGTSIGGIIGGLYASGYTTAQIRSIVDTTDWNYVLSLTQDTDRDQLFLSQKQTADKKQLTIRFDELSPVIPSAVSTGQRLTSFINQLTLQSLYHPIKNFDDLKIPFRSVATDLITGQKIVFKSGNLSEALRASISVPLLYSPLKKDTLELTDGGLVSNIPVEVAREFGADIIIVVNTISPMRSTSQLTNPWEVADQIINIMAQESNKRSLESATVVITPDLGNYSASDFTHLDVPLREGTAAAERAVRAITDSIAHKSQEMLEDSSPLSSVTFTIREFINAIPGLDSVMSENVGRSLAVGTQTTMANIRNILGDLYRHGSYSDIRADVSFVDEGGSIELHGTLNTILHDVQIEGNSLFPSDEVTAPFNNLLHKPVNVVRINQAVESILGMYRNNEYSLARVHTMSFDSSSGILRLTIDEGIISRIYLRGKNISRDWVIWRELGFRDGNIFTIAKAKQALRNLYGTNLFEQVLMDVAYEDEYPTIIIQMEEKPTDVSRLGIRADNERNLQPTLEFRNENLLGTATEIGARFSGGLRNRKYLLDFQANRVFNTYFTMNFDVFYDLRDIYSYTDDVRQTTDKKFVRSQSGEYRQISYGMLFQIGQQVERFGTVNVSYRLESDEIKFISGLGFTPEQYTLQALTIGSTIDTRDRYPFPRKGSLTQFSWETATSSLKSVFGDIGYSKIYFEYGTNFSYSIFTVHPKIMLGFGDQTLPLSQQFSLGGENSFFGLREYDSRGRQIFVINTEFRTLFPFKIIWDTYFRLRYDLGSIWPQREDIRLRDFHHGIGVGLSLDTPIGPANFSIGRSFYLKTELLGQPFTLGPIVGYFSLGYPIL